MSETAATPETAPATADQVVDMLVREQEAADQTGAETPAESTTSETTDPEPQIETPAPEPKHTVKVRGQEVEVTLEELRNGYSRNEDYKSKTAEVAEQRRAVEADKAAIAARATQLDALLSRAPFDPVLADGQNTDWAALARDNPAEYVARKEEHEGRLKYWQQVHHQTQLAQSQSAEAARDHGERRMAEEVPEWKDEGKRKALTIGISKTLESYGFKAEEYGAVNDYRILLVARDAMLYRQQQAALKTVEAKKTTPPPPRTLTPGTPQSSTSNTKATALLAKAARTGRVDDQVNAILATLE